MRTPSVAVKFFLENAITKVLDHSYVQSSFSTINRHLVFERHLTIEDFTDMDQHRCRACTKTFDFFSFSQSNLVFKFKLMLIE